MQETKPGPHPLLAPDDGNTLAAPIVGWVFCAPKCLTGTMTLGEVAQAVSALIMLQAALNCLVDNYPRLADCLSSVDRVAAVLHGLDEIDGRRPPREGG